MPWTQFDQVADLAPCKAGVGRDAGMNNRIVAVIEAGEIFQRIVGRIIVHVDEARRAGAVIVVMDHRIVTKAQLMRDGFEQALDRGQILRPLDFNKKCRSEA